MKLLKFKVHSKFLLIPLQEAAEGASSRASITTVSLLVEAHNLLVEPKNKPKNIPKLILYYFFSQET